MAKRWYRHYYVPHFTDGKTEAQVVTWSRTHSKPVAKMGLGSFVCHLHKTSSPELRWCGMEQRLRDREIWVLIQASTTDLLYDLEQAAYFPEAQFLYNLCPFSIEFIHELKKIMYKDGNTGFQMPSQTDFKTDGKLLEMKSLWAIASGTVGSRGSKDAKGSVFSFSPCSGPSPGAPGLHQISYS